MAYFNAAINSNNLFKSRKPRKNGPNAELRGESLSKPEYVLSLTTEQVEDAY